MLCNVKSLSYNYHTFELLQRKTLYKYVLLLSRFNIYQYAVSGVLLLQLCGLVMSGLLSVMQ